MPLKDEKLKKKIRGVSVVMVTPFKPENYDVNIKGLEENTEFLIKNKVNVLIPCGSAGEFFSLSMDEHKSVIKTVVEVADGRVPVFAGTGQSSTKATVELSRYAEDVGADGVMIMPPYYVLPGEEDIYQHYKSVSKTIKIGIIIYNIPSRTGVCIHPELMARLAEIDNVIGVKETSGDFKLFYRMIKLLRDRIEFSAGHGEIFAPYFLVSGASGIVSGIANFAPQFSLGIYNAALENDWTKVREIHFKMEPLYTFMETLKSKRKGTVYPAIFKESMNMLGLKGGTVRKPLLPLSQEERSELKRTLEEIEVLK